MIVPLEERSSHCVTIWCLWTALSRRVDSSWGLGQAARLPKHRISSRS